MLDWDGEFVKESWRLGLEIPRFHLICCSILHMTSYPTRSISDTGAFCLPHLVYLVIVPMIFVLLPSEDCTGCCSMPILFLWILGWICSLDAASIKNRHILSEAERGAASETLWWNRKYCLEWQWSASVGTPQSEQDTAVPFGIKHSGFLDLKAVLEASPLYHMFFKKSNYFKNNWTFR